MKNRQGTKAPLPSIKAVINTLLNHNNVNGEINDLL